MVNIETPSGDVPGIVAGPRDNHWPAILLAHGAGMGQDHHWMAAMRARLAEAGLRVMTFNYLYTTQGRKAPDRMNKLLDVHEAAAKYLENAEGPIVLAGKSMGGRVGSHLVADGRSSAVGLIYLGYPLVAMGKTERRDIAHLEALSQPQLFISGTRDRMGPQNLIADVAATVPNGTVEFIEAGDHSLVPLKSTGRTIEDSMDQAVAAVTVWMDTNAERFTSNGV